MDNGTTEMAERVINTTIGDLICAIRDAAQESMIDERHAAELTKLVLDELLSRRKS
jgi:hypothetical protein